jgi:hypothetical protein
MNSKNDAIIKLLHRTRPSEPGREERTGGTSRTVMLSNVGIALVTAALLAFALLPRVPLVGAGRPQGKPRHERDGRPRDVELEGARALDDLRRTSMIEYKK